MGTSCQDACCQSLWEHEVVSIQAAPAYQNELEAFKDETQAPDEPVKPVAGEASPVSENVLVSFGDEAEVCHWESPAEASIAIGAAQTGSGSVQPLKLEVEDTKLLRASLLSSVLSRVGTELRANSLSQTFTEDQATSLYRKSTEVQKIDYFISHCWQDSRVAKVFALYIHSNLWAAVILSILVALVSSLLTYWQVLPVVKADGMDIFHFPWAFFLGCASFFLALCTWHQIRDLSGFRRHYFLDKFCVHQKDADLKRRGVRAFAGFVAASQRLLLLWSPRYFTRLWCTLEMAALVTSKKEEGSLPVDIIPLTLAHVSVSGWMVAFIVVGTTQINRVIGNPLPDAAIIFISCWTSTYFLTAVLRQYSRDRHALEKQLQAFSIHEAECSLNRDRECVENSVLQWFEDVDSCNQHVRQAVRQQVLSALGPASHYSTRLLVPMVLFFAFNEADYIVGGYYMDNALRKIAAFFGMSAIILSLIPVVYHLPSCFKKEHGRLVDMVINLLMSGSVTTFCAGTFLIRSIVVNPDMPVWVVLIPAFAIAAAMWMQRASFDCARRSRQSL
ncbi:E3 ubiquitin-protein ligase ZNRF3 [Durusdinium trenchii]|uniref:E3 ubiquitin-protein ligase ZNRF3 n=1 Tax=Durusdinium trenchii TaxID=1381693 RepID=A0ABP0J3G7_9DINO